MQDKLHVFIGEQRGKTAIVLLNKAQYSQKISEALENVTELKQTFHNQRFKRFTALLQDDEFNKFKLEIIYPAQPEDVERFLNQKRVLIRETPEIYQKIRNGHILGQEKKTREQLSVILEQPQENRFFEDGDSESGFLVVKDPRCELKAETFRLLAIPIREDLLTLRDLTAGHLPLLRKMKSQAVDLV